MSIAGTFTGSPPIVHSVLLADRAVEQADVGRRAAHVEGDDARRCRRAAPPPARRSRRRPGPESSVRTASRLAGRDRDRAAVRLHDAQRARAPTPRCKLAQMAAHHRRDVGVHHRRAGALVLAVLGDQLVRQRDRHAAGAPARGRAAARAPGSRRRAAGRRRSTRRRRCGAPPRRRGAAPRPSAARSAPPSTRQALGDADAGVRAAPTAPACSGSSA